MSDPIAAAKRAAALAALAELPPSGTIGLGTGSTTRLFIDALGDLVAQGRRYTGVPTSEASRTQAAALGIPLLSDDGPWDIDVTVDGADEVSPALDLIKGGGGAHTREKIVNAASRRNVIIVDESKLSPHLGTRWSVPIEVLTFAHAQTAHHLAAYGTPTLRAQRTDSGNVIYDLACGPIADPAALDAALHMIPGVVETGLFVRRADVVLVARASGVDRLVRA
jgi:ribose 5-phosphate isomerase A